MALRIELATESKIRKQSAKRGRAGAASGSDSVTVMKLKHILLALSVLGVVVGSVTDSIYLDVALPIGSILFGLFMVVTIMEKESALYDQQLGHTPKRSHTSTGHKFSREQTKNPVLTHAHSH
jgi:hypothetical protein